MPVPAASLLINPHGYDAAHFDDTTGQILKDTIGWFEDRGLGKLTADYHGSVFYQEFLDFVGEKGIFANLLTPAGEPGGVDGARWDTARVAAMSEVLGFYGLNYWYPWQVTVLGLGPVWQSANPATRKRAAAALAGGGVAAFGLSEKEHGADIYSTDMVLTPNADGGYSASGGKYYIGNGNCAQTVSVFGRVAGVEGPDQYVFFYADSTHPNFEVVKNIVPTQMYVAAFNLNDYPVAEDDIMHRGSAAFDAALNTVNIGKFNLCFGGVGMATHSLYESITHADNRVLYGKAVTEMPHIQSLFVDAYARLTAMRLFSYRAVDYFRSANAEDRRYLLFNPVTKMKVTTEAEVVLDLLADVIAAKGFEKDNYTTIAISDVRGLPKLEGTVAVNLALINKFMPAYLFQPIETPEVPVRQDAANDDFLFHQGPARGLGKVRFHNWRTAYDGAADIANVALFREQAESFVQFLLSAPPSQDQIKDMDYMLGLGNLFTLIVYGQLILEQAKIVDLDPVMVDQVFDTLVRDFSKNAVELHGKKSSTQAQQDWAVSAIRKPVADSARFEKVWGEVRGLSGAYAMNP